MADMRGATSQQMAQNKQLEVRIAQEQQVSQRLRGQLQDIENQLKCEQHQIELMEHKRRVTEIEIKDNEDKKETLNTELEKVYATVQKLTSDNTNRRELLEQTNLSLTELGNMLQDMRHSTDKLRQLFWDQEKKIEYLRRDLDQAEEIRRQKEKQREDLRTEGQQLVKTLDIKKLELAVEKENEAAILKH